MGMPLSVGFSRDICVCMSRQPVGFASMNVRSPQAAMLQQHMQRWAHSRHRRQHKAGNDIHGDDLSQTGFHANAQRLPIPSTVAITGRHSDSLYDG